MTTRFTPKIIRSHRKTLSLQISADAELVVKAPYLYPKILIDRFLREKADWIRETQQRVLARKVANPKRQFQEGEEFLFLGVSYPLFIKQVTNAPLVFNKGFHLNAFNQKNARTYFTNWYKKQSQTIITQRVADFAARFGLSYGSIALSSATTRWGSCTHDNSLRFNWTLIMAPILVVDYVIVHELAHTIEKNHSRQFWREVEKMQPGYRIHRRWLKNNGHTLKI